MVERGGSARVCGKLLGVWEEGECRRTGDEEKQQQLCEREEDALYGQKSMDTNMMLYMCFEKY